MLPPQLLGFTQRICNSDLDTRKCSNSALWPRLLHPWEGTAQLQQKIIYLICSLVTAYPGFGGLVCIPREVTFWQEDLHPSVISLLRLARHASLPHSFPGSSCFLLSKNELTLLLQDQWGSHVMCIGRIHWKCRNRGGGLDLKILIQ